MLLLRLREVSLLSLAPVAAACGYETDASYAGGDYDGGSGLEGGSPVNPTGADPEDPEDPDEVPDESAEPEPAGCNHDDDVTLFLSPDDSNSMSSPVQAREAVRGGWDGLGSTAIRTWEFLNYYRFDYPPAPAGEVAVSAAMLADASIPGEYMLQIGVASEAMTNATRPPMNLTFVLDTSGSMEGQAMAMMKASCRVIAGQLDEGDVVSMVTWNTENSVVLANHLVQGPDDAAVLAAVEALWADGGTDLHAGLLAGYDLAAAVHRPGIVSRVVLISDGGANTGITDAEVIAAHAADQGGDGIYLVGVGVGDSQSYNDRLMDEVTDLGKGAAVFVPTPEEANSIFGERFVSTMAVAVRDVQVRLELPPGFEIVRFSGEEYSADPSEIEPQHLAPDDAMVFHQRIRTCDPTSVDSDSPISVTVRYSPAGTTQPVEVTLDRSFGELWAADSALLLEGAAVFEYATALAALQQGDVDATATLENAKLALVRALEAAPFDADLLEIESILELL